MTSTVGTQSAIERHGRHPDAVWRYHSEYHTLSVFRASSASGPIGLYKAEGYGTLFLGHTLRAVRDLIRACAPAPVREGDA